MSLRLDYWTLCWSKYAWLPTAVSQIYPLHSSRAVTSFTFLFQTSQQQRVFQVARKHTAVRSSAFVGLVHYHEFCIIRKNDVSGTGSVSGLGWGEEDTYSVGFLKKELTSVSGPALSKGPNRVAISLRSPEDGNTSSFRNILFSSHSEFRTMVKAQKPLGCTESRQVHVFTNDDFQQQQAAFPIATN
jgi:hypothetical protein